MLDWLLLQRLSCAFGFSNCRVLALKQPTQFCFTLSTTQFRLQTIICDVLQPGTDSSIQLRKKTAKDTSRLSNLRRYAFAHDPSQIMRQLFNEFHALTVAVGKAHCGKIPDCEHCPLADDLRRIERNAQST